MIRCLRPVTVRDLLTSRMGFGSVMEMPDTYPSFGPSDWGCRSRESLVANLIANAGLEFASKNAPLGSNFGSGLLYYGVIIMIVNTANTRQLPI
jgi:hypothetical protein